MTAIIAVLLGTLIGVALYYHSMSTMSISINQRDASEAFYIADAGIVHAAALINKVKKSNYSKILIAGANPTPNTGDELSAPPETGNWTSGESIPAGNSTAGGVNLGAGRYYVSVRNDTAAGETATSDKNGMLIVTSTGVGRDGATATIEAVVKTNAKEVPGLLINGEIKLNALMKVLGANGIMQINGPFDVAGTGKNSCAEVRFEFTGPPIDFSQLRVGPMCDQIPVPGVSILFNQPRAVPEIIDIPRLASEFKPFATFVFKKNGEIYPQTNGVERVTSLSALEKIALGLQFWDFNNSQKEWSHKTDVRLPDGNYYFEDSNVSMSKGGDSVNPPKVTIMAEGGITLNNEVAFQPFLNDYAMVAANDIKMSSKYSTAANPGIVYAYGQIQYSGPVFVVGGMVAADFYKSDGTNGPDANGPGGLNLVSRSNGVLQVMGTTTIVTSDGGHIIGSAVLSWREVRN